MVNFSNTVPLQSLEISIVTYQELRHQDIATEKYQPSSVRYFTTDLGIVITKDNQNITIWVGIHTLAGKQTQKAINSWQCGCWLYQLPLTVYSELPNHITHTFTCDLGSAHPHRHTQVDMGYHSRIIPWFVCIPDNTNNEAKLWSYHLSLPWNLISFSSWFVHSKIPEPARPV